MAVNWWTWFVATRVDAEMGAKKQIVVTFQPFLSSFFLSFLLFNFLLSILLKLFFVDFTLNV